MCMKVNVREKLGVEVDNESGKSEKISKLSQDEGEKPYPVSNPLLSNQGSTGRSRRWGCRCRCWCRGRSQRRPSHTCRLDRLQNTQKQNIILQNNPDLHIITYMQRCVNSINIMTSNLDTLL